MPRSLEPQKTTGSDLSIKDSIFLFQIARNTRQRFIVQIRILYGNIHIFHAPFHATIHLKLLQFVLNIPESVSTTKAMEKLFSCYDCPFQDLFGAHHGLGGDLIKQKADLTITDPLTTLGSIKNVQTQIMINSMMNTWHISCPSVEILCPTGFIPTCFAPH